MRRICSSTKISMSRLGACSRLLQRDSSPACPYHRPVVSGGPLLTGAACVAEHATGFLRSQYPCIAAGRTPLFAGLLGGVSGSMVAPASSHHCLFWPKPPSAQACPTSRRFSRGFVGLSVCSCARRDSQLDSDRCASHTSSSTM
jgi:hypothetical protein